MPRRIRAFACLAGLALAGCGALLGVSSSDDTPPPPPPPPPADGAPDAIEEGPGPAGDGGDVTDAADAADEPDGAPVRCSTCSSGWCSFGKCDPLVFVTSMAVDGRLGGGAGSGSAARADAYCNAAASGHFGGLFVAWASDETTNASTRVTNVGRPLRRPDGTIVAPNAAWLSTTNMLKSPIDVDETGMTQGGSPKVWTGTQPDGGKAAGNTCSGWSDDTGSGFGRIGLASNTDGQWTQSTDVTCTTMAHVYCIEIVAP